MHITNKYTYHDLERIDDTYGRAYLQPNGIKVPSVTTVLRNTSPREEENINRWKARVGEEEAAKTMAISQSIGTAVHDNMEAILLGRPLEFAQDHYGELSRKMFDQLATQLEQNVSEVWGSELHLFAQDQYAGTADCVGVHHGEEAIIDFKTTKRIKRKDWITDYFLQCCAYAKAHNQMYGTSIQKAVILMVDRGLKTEQFCIEGDEFEHYAQLWNARLEKFLTEFELVG